MKDFFGKGFGLIVGVYSALVAIQVIDSFIPDKYQIYKEEKEETKKPTEADFETE